MRVINADGSIPEMCGNGVRCVALHVARGARPARGVVRIETDAGGATCDVDDVDGAGQRHGRHGRRARARRSRRRRRRTGRSS